MLICLKRLSKAAGLLLITMATLAAQPGMAAEKTTFNVAWSIYVGWMPWDFADQTGILKKWPTKYGIKIKLTQVNDYVESMNQYTAGTFDACTMTNMDMLTIPAAGGVDSTALIVGDFSANRPRSSPSSYRTSLSPTLSARTTTSRSIG